MSDTKVIESTIKESTIKKRGRKPKYNTDEERREAKRLQNKAYRERKKQELIELRRLQNKQNIENNIKNENHEIVKNIINSVDDDECCVIDPIEGSKNVRIILE